MKTTKVTNTSLYDYLGRAAGPELGQRVYHVARKQKAMIGVRQVNTPTYEGPICEYTHDFLESFFKDPANKAIISKDRRAYRNKPVTKPTDTAQTKLPF